jgi:hypothetical protein
MSKDARTRFFDAAGFAQVFFRVANRPRLHFTENDASAFDNAACINLFEHSDSDLIRGSGRRLPIWIREGESWLRITTVTIRFIELLVERASRNGRTISHWAKLRSGWRSIFSETIPAFAMGVRGKWQRRVHGQTFSLGLIIQ